MTLFKKEKLGKKTRSRYELGTSAKELSRKVFEMKGLEVNEVVIKFEPEEMKPHEELKVYSQKELNEKTKNRKISLIKFEGNYKGTALNILVDYGLSLLNILSDSEETNEYFNNELNRQLKGGKKR